MSRDKVEHCSPTTSSYGSQNKPSNKSIENEEQQKVVTVLSRTDFDKVDRIVQTGSIPNTFKRVFNQRSNSKIKPVSSSVIIEDSEECEVQKESEEVTEPEEVKLPEKVKELQKVKELEIVKGKVENKKKTLPLTKPLLLLLTPETTGHKSMEPRRCSKLNVQPTKTPTDITRKKLEVELKAAEEIAKLKENVIEKRLAWELANLEDSNHSIIPKTHHPPPTSPQPQFERKCMEEPQRRVVSVPVPVPVPPEAFVQEREICYKYPFGPSRPVIPAASGCSRKLSPMTIKVPGTDSSSSVLAAFRNMTEKKFGSFGTTCKTSSPTLLAPPKIFKCVDSGCEMAKKHTEFHQNETASPPEVETRSKARIIWQSAMKKIKNKMRPKTPTG